MDQSNKPLLRLVPARPPGEDDPVDRYLPRLPWRYVLLGVLGFGVLVGGYTWKEQRKAAAVRAHITRVHATELAAPRRAYAAFRAQLEQRIVSAAGESTDTIVAPGFELANLRSGRGVYLRIPLDSARDSEHIDRAAKDMAPDWIPSCLGLAPTTARELYEIGAFLLPSFVADLAHKSVIQLRVQEDTLLRRSQTDLPNLLAATQSDWFMLVLEEGASRRDDPVRVFVWDLKNGSELLRARARSQGILLTTHILSQGTKPSGTADASPQGADAANDCSIAGAVKKLAKKL